MNYLERYGAGVDRRHRRIRRILLSAAALLTLVLALTFVFYDFREEQQVNHFLDLVRTHNYTAAYALWARTDSERRGYPLQSFLADWAPNPGPGTYRISKSRSCGSGVIVTLASTDHGPQKLWVERQTLALGFPPPPDTLPRICSF